MSKISKFIICCIALIISIVSLCVPTYCYDSNYSIDLIDELPQSSNFYNLSNIGYVKYKNFSISREVGKVVFYTTSVEYFTNYQNGYTSIIDNYDINLPNSNKIARVTSEYSLSKEADAVRISLISWNISSLDGYELSLNTDKSLSFDFHWIPNGILNSNYTYSSCAVYYGFHIRYDIDYNNQYFYNDTFCILSNMRFVSSINNTITFHSTSAYKEINLTDNKGNIYNNTIYAERENPDSEFYNQYIKFSTNGIDDIYITNVDLYYTSTYSGLGNYQFQAGRLYFNLQLKYMTVDNTNPMPLYSANTLGENSLSSTLIPIGSNNFYKTAEWWDIPSHLYNFFIYLIFDAPIISNFTNLVMVIINFIVEVFDFIIGLFAGINNIFFISIFVGIIVLIFLLKIIFKG